MVENTIPGQTQLALPPVEPRVELYGHRHTLPPPEPLPEVLSSEHDFRERLVKGISSAGAAVGRSASYFGRSNRKRLARNGVAYVRAHPGALLGVSAGLGFLVGILTRRR